MLVVNFLNIFVINFINMFVVLTITNSLLQYRNIIILILLLRYCDIAILRYCNNEFVTVNTTSIFKNLL